MARAIDTFLRCLADVFRNKGLEPPELFPETELTPALGLDSLDYAELVVRLEGAFGFDPFAKGVVPEIRTAGDMAALYESEPRAPDNTP